MRSVSPSDPKKKRETVTAGHVAREAGVSTAAVSFVLNQRGDAHRIAPATQQRILEVSRRLNYVPNFLARGLLGASTQTVGIVWPLGGAPNNAAVAYSLIQRLDERGYLSILAANLGSAEFTRKTLDNLAKRRVDALICYITDQVLDDPGVCEAIGRFKNAVVIGSHDVPVRADLIVHDRQEAMRRIVDHFVAAGRRRPAFMGRCESNRLKLDAFVDQCHKRGLAIDTREMLLNLPPARRPIDTVIGYLDDHFHERFPFDAVACANDEVAVALIGWLKRRGLRVPQAVAVVGFDDLPTAPHLDPPLASVSRLDDQLAELAETLLMDRLAGRRRKRQRCEVTMRFIPRESAGT